MNKLFRYYSGTVLLLLFFQLFCGVLNAQGPSKLYELSVGDKAPAIHIEKWLSGNTIKLFQEGHIYIFDFWANWCGPCISGFPYLSEIQKKYKTDNVHIIGVTSEDRWGNTLKNVIKLLDKKDTIVNYNMAWLPKSSDKDGMSGIFLHPWFKMAGIKNLPHVFIVDKKGFIAYIGIPIGIEDIVKNLIEDNYNLEVARKKYFVGREAEEDFKKFKQYLEDGKTEAAYEIGRELLDEKGKYNPRILSRLSSLILKNDNVNNYKFLDLALKSAKFAVEFTKSKEPGFLDSLAEVYFRIGEIKKAIKTEKKALSLSEGEMHKEQLKVLQKFEKVLKK